MHFNFAVAATFLLIALQTSAPPVGSDLDATSDTIATLQVTALNACGSHHDGENNCTVGFYCTNNTCKCRLAPIGIVNCSESGGFVIGDCYCATFDGAENALEVGSCALDTFECKTLKNSSQVGKMSNKFVNAFCSIFNRTGTLCGRCLPDHYPSAYSYNMNCIPCLDATKNWVRYIMAAYIPLTLFYFVVLILSLLRINLTSSCLHYVAFFCQAMLLEPITHAFLPGLESNPRILTGTKIIVSLYGIWNLDFFRPFYSDLCLGIGILPTLALDYAIAAYPLFLVVILYLLTVLYKNCKTVTVIRPLRVLLSRLGRNWSGKRTAVDALSTFFFLSNVKFLIVEQIGAILCNNRTKCGKSMKFGTV